MANKIQIKRSTTNATVSGLANGELAFTQASNTLWIGLPDGSGVASIGGVRNPGVLTANQALVANSTSGIDKVIVANAVITNIWANGASGTSGDILTSNGTGLYWRAPSAGVAGTDTQIQFNDGGVLAGDSGLTYNKTTDTLSTNNVYATSTVNAASLTVGTSVVANSTRLEIGTSVGLQVNGSIGTAGQILYSNGTTGYWAAPPTGDITAVTAGNGLTGGGTSGDVTIDIGAGAGISVTADSVSVLANTGIIANSFGVFVNAAYIATISANDATYFDGNSLATVQGWISSNASAAYSNATSYADTAAATAYSNATSYADSVASDAYSNATSYADSVASDAYSNATSYADTAAATAYSNATSYADNAADTAAATAYSNATSYADTAAATAYSNATSYADTAAATAYSNATSYADTVSDNAYSNAMSDTLSRNGTYMGNNTFNGTTTTFGSNTLFNGNITLGDATSDTITFTGRAGSDLNPTANVTYNLGTNSLRWNEVHASNVHSTTGYFDSNLTVGGDLVVSGNVTYISASELTVSDPLIHLAANNESSDSVDIGFIGHYSPDGGLTKKHTGFYRDASDNSYYLFTDSEQATFDTGTTTVNSAAAGYTQALIHAYIDTGALVSNSTVTNITANSTISVAIVANTLSLSTALPGTSGGTGLSSYTNQDLLVANSSNGFDKLAVGGEGYVLQVSSGVVAWNTLDGGTF